MKLTLFFLMAFSFYSIYGQTLNSIEITNKLKVNDKAIFIINGEVFNIGDSITLNKKLATIEEAKIINLIKLNDKAKETIGLSGDMVLLTYATQRSIKENKQILRKIRHIYQSKEINKAPILFLNNIQIPITESFTTISNLSLKEIFEISIDTLAKPKEEFEENAANGIIKIWLK